jgi:plastocyanin
MHLKFDSRVYSIFFGVGIFAFALPFVLALVLLMSPPALHSQREANGGETGGEGPARPTPNPNAGPPITFRTEGGEFYFDPDALSANNGQVVRVELVNVGSVEHSFAIANKPQAEDPEPWVTNDGELIAKAQAGTTARGGFTAPAPGTWVFYCEVPGHGAAGMHGLLTVQ